MEKFGATSTPTPGASAQPGRAAGRAAPRRSRWCRRRAWMPCATQNSRLSITASGWVKSTTTSAPASTSASSGSPRPTAATSSRSSAAVDGAARPRRPSGPRRRARRRAACSSRSAHGDGGRRDVAVASSNGPIDGEGRRGRRAPRRRPRATSSRVTASIRAEHVVDRQQLAVDAARPCRSGSSASRCPRGRARATPRSWPLPRCELLVGDAVRRRPCSSSLAADRQHVVDLARAGSRRRRRTGRCRRTARVASRPSRPGRASRGPPGTAATTCRRRARR